MKKIKIIMVSGKMHSGKGTFSKILEKELKKNTNANIIRTSLSKYIRNLVIDDFFYKGSQDTENCRIFMAKVYELGTKLYPHHKARRVWERDIVPNIVDGENIVIIESFREKNDNKYFYTDEIINQWDSLYTVRINRNHKNYDMKDNNLKNHKSEIDLDDFKFDYYINNDKDIENLREEAKKLIKSIALNDSIN